MKLDGGCKVQHLITIQSFHMSFKRRVKTCLRQSEGWRFVTFLFSVYPNNNCDLKNINTLATLVSVVLYMAQPETAEKPTSTAYIPLS